MIRVTFMLRRKPSVSMADFTDYWLHEHGPLVASVANKLNMLRYVQVHTLDDPANVAMAVARTIITQRLRRYSLRRRRWTRSPVLILNIMPLSAKQFL